MQRERPRSPETTRKRRRSGASIVDVARAAGVSPASVSLALNGRAGVGEDTRRRIESVARELAYAGRRPRAAAATDTLCFLHVARHGQTVNRDHDVFIADYVEGLGQAARAARMGLEIVTFHRAPVAEIVRAAEATSARGVVVLGTELTREEVEAFGEVDKPLVFLDTYHDVLPFSFVDMNNDDAVFGIVEHLQARGHRRIGMITGADATWNLELRRRAFASSLAHFGLPFDERHLYPVGLTFHGAHDGMREILKRRPALPTALFCANDIMACGCLRALREAGVRVPHDVSLVGFDDLPLASVADPPLTTVQVSKVEMGRTAVHLLVSQARGELRVPVKVLVGARLVSRESVRDRTRGKGR